MNSPDILRDTSTKRQGTGFKEQSYEHGNVEKWSSMDVEVILKIQVRDKPCLAKVKLSVVGSISPTFIITYCSIYMIKYKQT